MTAVRFEIIPTDDVGERLLRMTGESGLEPSAVTVTVTSLPHHGTERTVSAAVALAELGFGVVPHLAAHSIADRSELTGAVRTLSDAGVSEVFAVSGDGARPTGDYTTSIQLIRDLTELAVDPKLQTAGLAGLHIYTFNEIERMPELIPGL